MNFEQTNKNRIEKLPKIDIVSKSILLELFYYQYNFSETNDFEISFFENEIYNLIETINNNIEIENFNICQLYICSVLDLIENNEFELSDFSDFVITTIEKLSENYNLNLLNQNSITIAEYQNYFKNFKTN